MSLSDNNSARRVSGSKRDEISPEKAVTLHEKDAIKRSRGALDGALSSAASAKAMTASVSAANVATDAAMKDLHGVLKITRDTATLLAKLEQRMAPSKVAISEMAARLRQAQEQSCAVDSARLESASAATQILDELLAQVRAATAVTTDIVVAADAAAAAVEHARTGRRAVSDAPTAQLPPELLAIVLDHLGAGYAAQAACCHAWRQIVRTKLQTWTSLRCGKLLNPCPPKRDFFYAERFVTVLPSGEICTTPAPSEPPNRLSVFDATTGLLTRHISVDWQRPVPFKPMLCGLASDDTHLYVAERLYNPKETREEDECPKIGRLHKLLVADGTMVATVGHASGKKSGLGGVSGLALFGGELYICDEQTFERPVAGHQEPDILSSEGRVVVYNVDALAYQREIGKCPLNVTVDHRHNDCPESELEAEWFEDLYPPQKPPTEAMVRAPQDIAVSAAGVFVVDYRAARVKVFTHAGVFHRSIGSSPSPNRKIGKTYYSSPVCTLAGELLNPRGVLLVGSHVLVISSVPNVDGQGRCHHNGGIHVFDLAGAPKQMITAGPVHHMGATRDGCLLFAPSVNDGSIQVIHRRAEGIRMPLSSEAQTAPEVAVGCSTTV